jgi:phosphotransacetylase
LDNRNIRDNDLSILEKLKFKAKRERQIVFPEGLDDRILSAVAQLALALDHSVVGCEEKVLKEVKELGFNLDSVSDR